MMLWTGSGVPTAADSDGSPAGMTGTALPANPLQASPAQANPSAHWTRQ